MILGTHTSENEPNYLMLAQVQLPLEDAKNEACHYDDDRSDFGGFGCANGKVGLVIGKLGKNLDRGFVFDLIPTPHNDAGELASSLINSVKDGNKKKGSKVKAQSDSSVLLIDKDWVAKHARYQECCLVV